MGPMTRPDRQEAPRALIALVFVVSASVLAIQLVHMRLLSLSMWNSLVYCVITVVLLGFSVSGGVMSVWRRAATVRAETLIAGAALGFVVSNVIALLAVGQIEIDAARAMDAPRELLKLAVYFAALGVPYFAAGTAIGATFFRYPANIPRLYFANMLGSGVGCLLFVAAFPFAGERLVPVLSSAICLAAAWYARRAGRGLVLALIAVCVASAALAPAAPALFQVRICASKNLPTFQAKFPDARIEHSQWTAGGRVDVLGGGGLEHVNKRTGAHSPMKVLFTDGDAFTRLLAFSGRAEDWTFPTRKWGSGTVYALRKPERVAIIGVGGGTEVRDAIEYGASSVVGVEINPAIYGATASLYADYNGRLANAPGVRLLHAEGRSFINTMPDGQFDLVYMNGVDTWAAMASGAYSLAENYLYTTDALREYLRVAQPDGAISISRYAFRVPRESLRLGITMIEALRESGVAEPWRNVAFLVDVDWGTIIAKKQPFTETEIATLESLQDQGHYKIAYRPGVEDLPATAENVARYGTDVWHPAPYGNAVNPAAAYIKLLRAGRAEEFFASYPYDVRPCSDDRPFFFKLYKWQSLFHAPPQWAASGGSFAYVVLAVLLTVSVVSLAALVFIPLALAARRGSGPPLNASTLGAAFYFACLGAGYMTIEIALMQKLTLFVAHPTYAIATVLSTMLIASGMGSLVSGWLSWTPRRIVAIAAPIIAILALLTLPATQYLLPYWLGQGVVARNILAAALVAPLAF
ncbi:MAG: class I SAM-dependent methyltransferase, partial [Candidatus Hydrogenedentes bacterium]|nr:class I SAM-dependent methyltransferase [Candidatus Hydrogenedentota bacterium]